MKKHEWRTDKAGAINRLQLGEAEIGPLQAHDVRIAVKAIGLNFADIFALTGLYSATPKGSFVPGLEFSGIVVESNDATYQPGDRVMGVTRFGGYSSLIDSPAHYLTPLPDLWSFHQGAAYLVQTLTAFYALTELGNVRPKHRVLIHSAAGGVGLQAMKLCQQLGAHPIGTVSGQKKRDFLYQQGFHDVLVREHTIDRQLADYCKQVQAGFDLILDGVGGAVQKASFDQLNPMGRLVVFGAAEFTPGKNRPNYLGALFKYLKRPKYDVMDMISDNKSVLAFNLIWLWEQVAYLTELIADMQTIQIAPPAVGHVFDFKEAKQAIECLRSGNTIGKVVLDVSDHHVS